MMSWLEEEIGIPPEPKHPKAVGPVIQTAGGGETEPESERERESVGEREKRKEKYRGFGEPIVSRSKRSTTWLTRRGTLQG